MSSDCRPPYPIYTLVDTQLSHLGMSNLTETIRTDVREAIANDQLELPTLPEVALRIRETAQSESVSASSLCHVIGQDPGLSARLIQIANSPMFRGVNTMHDLQMAIGRLGVEYLLQ